MLCPFTCSWYFHAIPNWKIGLPFSAAKKWQMNGNCVVIIFAWLRVMQPRKRGSVLGRGKRVPSSLIRPYRLCGTSSLLCNGHLATSPETERSRREFDHLFLSSSEIRMRGAQLLIPYTLSYSTEEQLYDVTANHTVTRIYFCLLSE